MKQVTTCVVMVVCCIATGFLLISSYETLFQVDVAYAHTLDKVTSYKLMTETKDLDKLPVLSLGAVVLNDIGQPTQIKVPTQNVRLRLGPAVIKGKGEWLARSNNGHYLVTQFDEDGSPQRLIVYMRKSWRTIDEPEELKSGDNLFIDTNKDWRYMFRIVENSVYRSSGRYVPPSSTITQLILLIEDVDASIIHVIRADFVNLQNILQ